MFIYSVNSVNIDLICIRSKSITVILIIVLIFAEMCEPHSLSANDKSENKEWDW